MAGGDSLAVVLVEPYHLELRRFPLPVIGPEDLLLKVLAVGICGSDLKIYEGHWPRATFPLIMGHELVGEVVEVGPEAAREYGVALGDRVVVEPYILCRRCYYCLTGYYQLCRNMRCYGINLSCQKPPYLWGAYSQYLFVAPGSKVHKVPPEMPLGLATLSSIVGNGVRWVIRKGNVGPMDRVVIIGPGIQGLTSTIIARQRTWQEIILIGTGKDSFRLAKGKELGATHTINVQEQDPVSAVREITGGEMADVVLECSGSPAALHTAVELLRPLGRLVIVGMTGGKEVSLRTDEIAYKELTIYGGLGQAWDVEPALSLMADLRLPFGDLVTHYFPLEQAEHALRVARGEIAGEEAIKVVLLPWSSS